MAGVEAAALSAAVSVALKIVGSKLALLVIKKYSSVVRVTKDLQELRDLADQINCYLETAALGDAQSFKWLKNLKDVAYDVDDVVDEFQLEAEKHETFGDGGIMFEYMHKKTKSVKSQWVAAKKIKAIKKRFSVIVEQRNHLNAIANSFQVGPSVHHMSQTTVEIPLPIVDAASVLGRDQDKCHIISKLVETKYLQKIKIISIIGLGGSGKTTLAKLVFNDDIIKKHFQVALWVPVSQEFNVKKLVENLFEAITKCKSNFYPLQHMSETISKGLTGNRFLLVLDDAWTENPIQWEQFMVHVKTGAPGSKILLTTRSRRVAEAVESSYLFDLPLLSQDVSWQLFDRNFRAGVIRLSSEFQEVGKQIVKKCGGVPLAIKVLACVLQDKERIEQWEAIRDNSLLDTEGEERRIFACLKLSYFHLPSHLKPCFTLCSLFPKGYMIDKEQLIDQWIAHDMIAVEDGVSYLECTANKYFNSLVQMSLLQNVEEGKDGKVVYRMHDLVHDLARSMLSDEISEVTSSTKSYRYFCLMEQPEKPVPENIFGKARAVYVTMCSDSIYSMALKHANHLRSVTVGSPSALVPKTMFQIKYLRYLAMSGLECETLPEAFSDLWSLEALHLTHSFHLVKLPESIGKLKKLRTLNLSSCRCLEGLPESIGDCHMITNINLCNCDDLRVLPNSIGRNKKLRVLGLGFTRLMMLPSCITTLENLESLDLRWCSELDELPEGIGKLKKLEVLNLEGCEILRSTLAQIRELSQLQNLNIFIVGQVKNLGLPFRNNSYPIFRVTYVMDPDDAHRACFLKRTTNLQSLGLYWEWTDHKMDIDMKQAVLGGLEPPPGIKNLYIDGYAGGEYAKWMLKQVGGGVQGVCQFTCLTVMSLSHFPNLKHLDGLVVLPCLENLELLDMPSLESISGGPFPSLAKLVMKNLPNLGDVWMITERTLFGREERYMQIGTCLSHVHIKACPILTVKPHIPLSLEHLLLDESNYQLLQLPAQVQGTSLSSPSLHYSLMKELKLWRMTVPPSWPPPGLGSCHDLWLLQQMTALETLTIEKCHNLTELPDSIRSCMSLRLMDIEGTDIRMLPESLGQLWSLEQLRIISCNALEQLPESLGELRSLRILNLRLLQSLNYLPQSMCFLTSLEVLKILNCPCVESLPKGIKDLTRLRELIIDDCNGLSSLPQSMSHLASLQVLQIEACPAIHQLPDLGGLCSLRMLKIKKLPRLTCLPQLMCPLGLTSLEDFWIHYCPGIKSLPEGIKGLTTLRTLSIHGCPDLERRCERQNGEDWSLISHIPKVYIF